MTEDFKLQNEQLLALAKEARADGEFCSIVTRMEKGVALSQKLLLLLQDDDLELRNAQRDVFRQINLESIRNVQWVRNNPSTLWIQLQFESEGEIYDLHFWNETSFRKWHGNNRIFRSPFGRFIWWARISRRLTSLREANFAEAEKWRTIFPDAPFPNTEIKNAKS